MDKAEAVWRIDLEACRPQAISFVDRKQAVRLLPTGGTVLQLNTQERSKVEGVARVLRLYHRDDAYEVRVITVPQAWTGLHERAVLLISHPALTLLHREELQAIAAHEIGHEYVWKAFLEAKIRKDAEQVRELELVCDVIAMRTLVKMRLSPTLLQTAIEKMYWYNHERFGIALNQSDYPSLKERQHLLRTYLLGR